MKRLRAVLVSILVGVILYGTATATLEALRPVAFSAERPAPRTDSALPDRVASHVLFAVVDGLRWDIAHDAGTMPHFSAALQRHTSGEIWSSPISMTSSAVLAYGTGQRASLDQVLENLRPPSLRVNSWLQNAHASGLGLVGAGDPVWEQLYGAYFSDFRADPVGVAIGYDFNALTFRAARDLQSFAPDFLVAHFVTPDHQGHAHGVHSEQYREHMRGFDRELFAWLDALPLDWTVIVTSDHGAAASGTHGTDTAEQRRCPIFAYGHGIRPSIHVQRRLDQAELPGLFAGLLGVPNAEQSRAAALLEWLDVSPAHRRQWACAELARIDRIGGPRWSARLQPVSGSFTAACCAAAHDAHDCALDAREAAAAYDAALGSNEGIQSRRAWPWIGVVLAALLAVGLLAWGKPAVFTAAWLSAWLLCSLALTFGVERLPGAWPNTIRVALFAAANLLLLAGVFRFGEFAGRFHRQPALLLSIFPGWLLVSYSVNTQVQAYLVVSVLSAALAIANRRTVLCVESSARVPRCWSAPAIAALVLSIAALALAGTKSSDVRPVFFLSHRAAGAAVAGAVLLAGLLWFALASQARCGADFLARADGSHGHRLRVRAGLYARAGAAAIVAVCFGLQHLPLHWIGRLAWLVTTVAATICARFKRRELAFALALASYAWLARDYEWLVVIPALVLADSIGGLPAAPQTGRARMSFATCAVHVTCMFSLTTLLRIGLQGGIQLETLDFTAGSFGNQALPVWLSAGFLGCKFLTAQVLLLALYLRRLAPQLRARLLMGVGMTHLLRGGCLLLMLFVCGRSYWTAFRVVADLPLAMLSALGVVPMLAFAKKTALTSRTALSQQ
jgi:hypothetical protein